MAPLTRRTSGRRRARLAVVASGVALLAALPLVAPEAASADTSPGPTVTTPQGQTLPCQPENYPHGGAPRSSPYDPYEIPFVATLGNKQGGGYLEIASPSSPFTVILGGPVSATGTGSITAEACGLLALPNESGGISANHYGSSGNDYSDQYNANFYFNNPIDVSVGMKGISLPILHAWASADGELQSAIEPTPAANGGMNVSFKSSAKATTVLTAGALTGLLNILGPTAPAALVKEVASLGNLAPNAPVSGGECTVPIGDLSVAGMPSSDFGTGPGQTGLAGTANTTATYLTSGAVPSKPVDPSLTSGQPVTGPITAAQAVLVGNQFPVAAIETNTPPSPGAPGAGTPAQNDALCNATNAGLFNQILGLPSPPGYNLFYAPGTFAVFTSG